MIGRTIAPVVSVPNLIVIARRTQREEFIQRFPHPFLARPKRMNTAYSREPADWDTAVRVFDGSEKPEEDTANRLRFVPIVRRGESPYSDFISAGRADNCDVILKDQSVSKLHGLFWVPNESNPWLISDARSVNGLFLNGERLAALEKVKLTAGDVIRFGDVRVRFLDAGGVFDLLSGKE